MTGRPGVAATVTSLTPGEALETPVSPRLGSSAGKAGLLVIVGALLFVIPEPITSALGLALLVTAFVWWFL